MSPFEMFIDYLLAAVALGMVFLLGCTGEILTEKVGHLNLGIPGIMCVGAASGCLALKFSNQIITAAFETVGKLSDGSIPEKTLSALLYDTRGYLAIPVGIIATLLGGALMGAIYSFLTVTLKANQNVTGLAMTIFGNGITKYIMHGMGKTARESYLYAVDFFRIPFKAVSKSVDFKNIQYWGIMMFLAIIIAVVAAIILTRTRVGLHLRAVGENPATADAVGINVTGYKYGVTCIGSAVAALGGFYYVIDYAGSYESYNSIEALGWLSVALVIFTLWRPQISIIGSIIFGMLYLAGGKLPTILGINLGKSMPYFLEMLPYVVTIIVLIIISVRKKRENQPPASLGVSYFREER